MRNKRNIGDIYTWKDRPGRIRVMIYTENGVEEAARYFYKKYHPDENIDEYRIVHLSMNMFNFAKNDLVKLTPRHFNLVMNNRLLVDSDNYLENQRLNKMAILLLDNIIVSDGIKEVMNDE